MYRLSRGIPLLIAFLLVYLPLGGWRLIHGGGTAPEPAQRTYGATHSVPDFAWVVLLNQGGLSTGSGRLAFFDTCLVRYRGQVREVTSHHSLYTLLTRDVLVEYAPPTGAEARGVLCPQGAVFLLPKAELAAYNGRYAARSRQEAQLADEVTSAARQRPMDSPRQVEADLRWVEAANPAGLQSFGYEIGFLDACAIERGGTVQALAGTSAGTLYAYQPDPRVGFRGVGIPCPAQTLFLQRDVDSRRL